MRRARVLFRSYSRRLLKLLVGVIVLLTNTLEYPIRITLYSLNIIVGKLALTQRTQGLEHARLRTHRWRRLA